MSEAEINALTHAVFDAMLEDLVLGIALNEHKAELKNRSVCGICHTRCRLEEHINQGTSNGLSTTPSQSASGANTSVNGAGTKSDLPVLLDCIKCQRQVTPNRYANHLAGCLGLGNTRRTGPRNAASKPKAGTDSGTATPLQRAGSMNGTSEDQGTAPPPKPKASKKKKKPDTPEPTNNNNNKREGPAPPKPSKSKKQKVGKATNGKPLAFQPADLEESSTLSMPAPSPPKTSAITRVPSKLQTSQTPISPAGSASTTPTHTPHLPPALPPRMVRGTGPPRPLLGRGPSIPQPAGVLVDKALPPPIRQSSVSHSRTEGDGDLDDLADTASDSSDDT